jgi:hypothetical protein
MKYKIKSEARKSKKGEVIFILKWIGGTLLIFMSQILIKITGFQRYSMHDSMPLKQVWQEIITDPTWIIVSSIIVGFIIAKHFPKIK